MMYFAAIDPGASGALVVIDTDMNIVNKHPFIGWKNAFDAVRMLPSHPCIALLEKVHALPKQGVSSSFTFGANYGGWKALLEGFRIPYEEVRPQKWQTGVLGSFPSGESKKRALEWVRKRFPNEDFSKALSNKEQSGIVDALCMAVYIRAKYYQDNPGAYQKEKHG